MKYRVYYWMGTKIDELLYDHGQEVDDYKEVIDLCISKEYHVMILKGFIFIDNRRFRQR